MLYVSEWNGLSACEPRVLPYAVGYILVMGLVWLECWLFWRPNTDKHFSLSCVSPSILLNTSCVCPSSLWSCSFTRAL